MLFQDQGGTVDLFFIYPYIDGMALLGLLLVRFSLQPTPSWFHSLHNCKIEDYETVGFGGKLSIKRDLWHSYIYLLRSPFFTVFSLYIVTSQFRDMLEYCLLGFLSRTCNVELGGPFSFRTQLLVNSWMFYYFWELLR